MRVTELYNNQQPVVSMEFFPPRDEQAAQKFDQVVDDLAAVKPDYMSVTFGAGGSNREGSYQTVKKLMIDKGKPTVAYITGYGLGPNEITDVLDKYRDLGVETIFVIRGDKPRDDQFVAHPESFSYASELIAFIRENYDFILGCAGYPEGHIEAESLEKDIGFLKRKQDSGASYVVAQYCYDNQLFFDYVARCREAGVTIPIVPGIMPVYTLKLTENLCKICGSSIPDNLRQKMAEVKDQGSEAVRNMGIDFALAQCRELLENGVCGLHFYTMDRSISTVAIVNQLRQENLL